MASLNKVMLIGNLGADPEMRFVQSGSAVANFNLAVNRKYKDREGEDREDTEWVRIVAWARLAEIAGQYLQKGSQVFVEGRMQTRKWEDRDGNTRYTTEVVAFNIQFLGGGRNAGSGGGGRGDDDYYGGGGGGGYQDAGDLPFE